MRAFLIIIVCILYAWLGVPSASGQYADVYPEITESIFKGKLTSAENEIDSRLSDHSINDSQKTALYTMAGEIHKLRGNMERALLFWEQSNTLRRKLYPPGDYRLAWNYALLSNYHYEMIEMKQAIAYADTCSALITNLTIDQQLELETHRIWNILAQSYKSELPVGGHSNYEHRREIYKPVFKLYEQSIAFQIEHHTPIHYLAKTYHLYANAYLDLTGNLRNVDWQHKIRKHYFETADLYYAKAIAIWQELYGDVHYEHGKTRFLKALLHHWVRRENHPGNYDEIIQYYAEALVAFGIDDTPSVERLKGVPNKVDLLMCLKHHTMALLDKQEKTGDSELLNKAEKINEAGIRLWKIIHEEFKANNQNLALSLYYLVPFENVCDIEFRRYQLGMDFSYNKIFEANQYLKYYDLLKKESEAKGLPAPVSIKETQQKLNDSEWFIDFFDNSEGNPYALAIAGDTIIICSLPGPMRNRVRSFNYSIVEFNAQTFTELSHKLFNDLFSQLPELSGRHLIICPQEYLNQLPFEALLVTPPADKEFDFRKLDYLVHHCEIEYTLSAATFRNYTGQPEFSVSAFAPDYSRSAEYAELPFSQRLVNTLSEKEYGTSFRGDEATTKQVLKTATPILHLSGHGLIEPDLSEFSNLVLNDGLLNLDDVYANRTNADLVVLNTCNSSLGNVLAHDGINGFARAFLSTGALSVLTNLWEVDDRTSNQLLEHFYIELHSGQSTTAALRTAQLKQIEQATSSELAAPYYWAGHRLVGEKLRFSRALTSGFPFSMTAILVLVIATVGLGMWRLRMK